MINIQFSERPYVRWSHASYTSTAIGGIALTVSTLAGSTFAALAKQLRSSLSAMSLLFVSEILTGFFVLFSFGFLPVIRAFRAIEHTKFKWMMVMAFYSGVAGPFLWFTSLSYTTAINASLFGKTEMIFLLGLAACLLKEKFTRAHIAAILSVLAGMIIISLRGLSEGITFHPGDLMVVASVMCYAVGNIIFRAKLHGSVEPHIALLTRSSVAVMSFFLISPFIEHPFISEILLLPATMIPVLLIFAFVSRFLNSVTYYMALGRLPVTTVSLVSTLDIIGSIAFAFFYLGEPVAWYHYAGGAFIVLGNILLELLGTHPTQKHLEQHLKQRLP